MISDLSSQYNLWLKWKGHEKHGNDHQFKKPLVVGKFSVPLPYKTERENCVEDVNTKYW